MMARTPTFLMANLGAEMSRLFSFREAKDAARADASAARALSIIADIDKSEGTTGAKQEAAILKDIIEDIQSRTERFLISRAALEDYFAPIALRALGV